MTFLDSASIALRDDIRLRTVEHDATYVFAEAGVTALRGEGLSPLLASLDGTRTLAEILSGEVPGLSEPDRVAGIVAGLAGAGLLVSVPSGGRPADPGSAYWQACGVDVWHSADDPGSRGRVLVRDLTGTGAGEMMTALAGCGVRTVADHADATLTVVLCDDHLDERLAPVDLEQRRTGRPWLLVKPGGVHVSFGPFLGAGAACWRCLADQMWPHRALERFVQERAGWSGPVRLPSASLPATRSFAINAAALEVARTVRSGIDPAESGAADLVCLDTVTFEWRRHRVRRRPQCPACGDPALVARRARQPPDLSGAESRPEETWDRYRHLVSPLTGVLKEIRPDDRLPRRFHCFRSGPPLVASVDGLDQMCKIVGVENGGKGASEHDGRVGALCEALERHSGQFQGDELRIRARFDDVADRALHPNEIQLYSGEQLRTRLARNARHGAFQHVVEPFDTGAELAWTPVQRVRGGQEVLAPTAMLYYGVPAGPDHRFVRADSNGTAAGPSFRDATVAAALELIERDAVAIWWYNRLRCPGVDLDWIGDPWADDVRELYESEGRQVWALDLTTDLGVPVVGVLSRRTDADDEQIAFGFAADLDPRSAVRRALAEMNQIMPSLFEAARSREPVTCADPDAQRWWRTARLEDQDHLRPDGPPVRPGPAVPGDPLDVLVSRIERAGSEVLVLDQTRPDIGLPVARVLAPGLRHFWARFGAGRLFNVPVATGRRAVPTPYEDLNPEPMFL